MTTALGIFDRYPFNSPWLRHLVLTYGLPVWFGINTLWALAYQARDTSLLYFDARLYLDATDVWLNGGNPWSVDLAGNFFAAPPTSMLPLIPFALLPRDLGVALIAGLVIGGSILAIRLLKLPWWWIAFPPLVQCMLSANVHGLVLPLILIGAGPIAAAFKAYAVLPLVILGRWRALLITAAGLIATIPFLPWSTYLADFWAINARLEEQTHFALTTPILVVAIPFALVAMWVVGRERAAWLSVPALWPSQQYYYGSIAMGARSGLAAAIVALPVNGSGLIALFVLALVEWHRRRSGSTDRTFGAVTPRTGSVDSLP